MKTARLEFRVDPDAKGLIQQAAAFLGTSLTDFAAATLTDRAREVVESHTIIRLANEDRDAFLAAMDSPPKPSDALKRAFDRHRRDVGE